MTFQNCILLGLVSHAYCITSTGVYPTIHYSAMPKYFISYWSILDCSNRLSQRYVWHYVLHTRALQHNPSLPTNVRACATSYISIQMCKPLFSVWHSVFTLVCNKPRVHNRSMRRESVQCSYALYKLELWIDHDFNRLIDQFLSWWPIIAILSVNRHIMWSLLCAFIW